MASDGAQYAIGDLAGLAGATPRTIRYYVAQGLLPPPVGGGAGAHYTDDHLARLRLIRRLQRQHQPLSEIRQRLTSLGEREVAALVAAEPEESTPPDSALDYLRTVLATPSMPTGVVLPARPGAPGPPPAPSMAAAAPMFLRRIAEPKAVWALSSEVAPQDAETSEPAPADEARAETGTATVEQRSQWDRIALTPNIEIHVRRPLGRLENRRVERLITIARQLLREEQP